MDLANRYQNTVTSRYPFCYESNKKVGIIATALRVCFHIHMVVEVYRRPKDPEDFQRELSITLKHARLGIIARILHLGTAYRGALVVLRLAPSNCTVNSLQSEKTNQLFIFLVIQA
jgi:hypothetical protein